MINDINEDCDGRTCLECWKGWLKDGNGDG